MKEAATLAKNICDKDGALIVTPVRKKFNLAELLSKMPDRSTHVEMDWGKPEGDEAWCGR